MLVSAALLLGVIAIVVPLKLAVGREDGALVAFSIPEQSLETAIQAFAETSGAQVLYETALTAEYGAPAVHGRFTVEAALQILLSESPLQARATAQGAFTLIRPEHSDQARAAIGRQLSLQSHGHFLGIVQNAVLDAFCRSSLTRPGPYRISVQLWIGPSGSVSGASLLAGTGQADRDAAIMDALGRVALSSSPPADLPQPLTMTVAARSPQETGDCGP